MKYAHIYFEAFLITKFVKKQNHYFYCVESRKNSAVQKCLWHNNWKNSPNLLFMTCKAIKTLGSAFASEKFAVESRRLSTFNKFLATIPGRMVIIFVNSYKYGDNFNFCSFSSMMLLKSTMQVGITLNIFFASW